MQYAQRQAKNWQRSSKLPTEEASKKWKATDESLKKLGPSYSSIRSECVVVRLTDLKAPLGALLTVCVWKYAYENVIVNALAYVWGTWKREYSIDGTWMDERVVYETYVWLFSSTSSYTLSLFFSWITADCLSVWDLHLYGLVAREDFFWSFRFSFFESFFLTLGYF